MSRLTTLLRTLGAEGAVANVRTVLEARHREDWVVDGLVRRLDPAPSPAVLPATGELGRVVA